ncbi:penicillin acylase family protein [Paenacidovorax monticola]|uniref:Penicillin acylase family protein n=1 Tax=Paenacidovorax monticola TaxID=1926868 RepID=A0A7H0HI75_9BURK|nr:penicillin acylase family protein [Paenacidovorax monticola]
MSRDTAGQGQREALFGTSYLQAVGFTAEGPRARALLAYSQSANPDSPYYADQTEKFSRREWVELPFTPSQIEAQAVGARTVISE